MGVRLLERIDDAEDPAGLDGLCASHGFRYPEFEQNRDGCERMKEKREQGEWLLFDKQTYVAPPVTQACDLPIRGRIRYARENWKLQQSSSIRHSEDRTLDGFANLV